LLRAGEHIQIFGHQESDAKKFELEQLSLFMLYCFQLFLFNNQTIDVLIAWFYKEQVVTKTNNRGIIMASWKGYSKRQKMQVATLFIIWVLFGLINTLLYINNVTIQIHWIYGELGWILLGSIFAVVTWFILRKKGN
jgi:hypothetical protein